MGFWQKQAYKCYKKLEHLPSVATLASFIYTKDAGCRYDSQRLAITPKPDLHVVTDLSKLKIALVCDEMTWQVFKDECQCVFLTPANWLDQMEKNRPDIFFCEAAWSGIDAYKDCWRGRVYKNHISRYENRRTLLNILDYCQKSNIPAVFWNKEDPAFFADRQHDFVDTALKFDHVFTTDAACVAKYWALGQQNAAVLPFGFSPRLFNPAGSGRQKEAAIFVGSWYQDQTKRCSDTKAVFDLLKKQDIPLTIYDRHYGTDNPLHFFPACYSDIILPAIPFEQLGQVIKQYCFGVNINTVTDSNSMFARRVFELMACNTLVVSNKSQGMRKLFDNTVWFIDEPFDLTTAGYAKRSNLREVFLHHTWRARIADMLQAMQIKLSNPQPAVTLIHPDKLASSELDSGYFYLGTKLPQEIDFALAMFGFVDLACGVRFKNSSYDYVSDNDNTNVLFHHSLLPSLQKDLDQAIVKFDI